MNRFTRCTTLLLAGAVLTMSACGDDDTGSAAVVPPADAFTTTYVGEVAGTDAFVAVAVEDGQAWAYLCDGQGEPASDELANYLTGVATDTTIEASDDEGVSLDATFDDDAVTGTLQLPDGTAAEFVATRAADDAGWFSAVVGDADRSEVGSWIRLADGQVRGKAFAIDGSAAGGDVVAEPDALGGGGGSVPPAAVPTGALKCYLKTKKYHKVLQDESSTNSQINGANNERMDACGFFNNL